MDTSATRAAIYAAVADPSAVDTISLNAALRAQEAGLPVYWHNRTYSDAFATIFLDLVHAVGLDAAAAEMAHRHSAHPEAAPARLLARLIPISESARAELSAARARLGLVTPADRSAA